MKTADVATRWEDRYAGRARRLSSSAIRELLKYTQKPEVISFAGGLPAPEVFPYEEVRLAAERVIREHGDRALRLQHRGPEVVRGEVSVLLGHRDMRVPQELLEHLEATAAHHEPRRELMATVVEVGVVELRVLDGRLEGRTPVATWYGSGWRGGLCAACS